MTENPARHHRRSIRLRDYDYSQVGAYFVTVCTHNRTCLFGDVVDGEMVTNDAGRIVQAIWKALPLHYPGVALDEFVIMPKHVHGIIVLDSGVGAQFIAPPDADGSEGAINRAPTTDIVLDSGVGAQFIAPLGSGGAINRALTTDALSASDRPPTLGDIVRGFKARSTRLLRRDRGYQRVWQRNYYEHVLRDKGSLSRVREYISNNPLHWAFDRENPVHHAATDQ
jgi:REP element-mobilizing transposase RayT